jgi:hypothetical protein
MLGSSRVLQEVMSPNVSDCGWCFIRAADCRVYRREEVSVDSIHAPKSGVCCVPSDLHVLSSGFISQTVLSISSCWCILGLIVASFFIVHVPLRRWLLHIHRARLIVKSSPLSSLLASHKECYCASSCASVWLIRCNSRSVDCYVFKPNVPQVISSIPQIIIRAGPSQKEGGQWCSSLHLAGCVARQEFILSSILIRAEEAYC